MKTQGGTVSAVEWVAWRTDRVSRGDAVGHTAYVPWRGVAWRAVPRGVQR